MIYMYEAIFAQPPRNFIGDNFWQNSGEFDCNEFLDRAFGFWQFCSLEEIERNFQILGPFQQTKAGT